MFEGYRLSPQQRQLWMLEHEGQYAQLIIAIEGPLDKALLLQTLREVRSRYEILHTDLQFTPGMKLPVQVVIEDDHLDIQEYDLQDRKEQVKIEEYLQEVISAHVAMRSQLALHALLFVLSKEKHLLALTMPTFYADSASLHNLLHEIATGYALDSNQLADAGMQYADISQWLNDLLASEDKTYTLDYLTQVEQLISLKLPSAQAHVQHSTQRASHSTLLDTDLQTKLYQLAQKQDISPADTLLSCWQLLLWHLTLHQDFAIGVMFDGRNYAELETALGPLALCVPLHIDLTEDMTWAAMARQLHTLAEDIYQHQEDFLWEKVARQYQLELQAPRFSFGFEFLRQQESYTVKHTTFSIFHQQVATGQFELKLTCGAANSDGLSLTFDYDPAIYSAQAISRLIDQFVTVVRTVLQQPEATVGKISVLGQAEQKFLLEEINQTAMEIEPVCLHTLFEAQVRRTPHAIALVDGSQTLTYEELDERAGRLASYLQASGVGPDVLVALYAERSLEALVAMLAILKAGGAYVPLDPTLSLEQVATLLTNASIGIVLTTERKVQEISHEGLKVVYLPQDFSAALPPRRPLVDTVTPLNLAYVIFTSGSTGTPKGVAIEHRQISNYVIGIAKRLNIVSGSTFAIISTLAADLGHTTLFSSLCTGGKLHIIDPEQTTDPDALATYLMQHPVDYLKIVPAHLAALLSGTQPASIIPRKNIILGGETLHWNLVERLYEIQPACSIVNHYGPTETTVGALAAFIQNDSKQGDTCPIGSPLANTQVYLLDADLQVVPTLLPGEIYIGGNGVGRGYLGLPALTAERFIPDPFSSIPGARLYRTGDLGRYLLDGRIEFLGRTDDQVKIRGFRVEPAGIAAQLRLHPEVQDVVVLPDHEDQEHRRLTAYVVPKETAAPIYKGRERYLLPNNLAITQLNTYETDFFYEQIFVHTTELQHGITLPDNPVVFDIGANIGLFTLFIHQFYKGARIYAFEPLPPIFEVLQVNAELYAADTTLFRLGLSDHSGEETFTYYPQSSCQSGYYADVNEDMQTLKAIMLNQQHKGLAKYIDTAIAERAEAVQFVCNLKTLSEVMHDCSIDHIDLLKIDVEKSELDILRGIAAEDWPKIDQIVIEAHDVHGRIAILTELLEQQGYNLSIEQSKFIQNTTLYNLYARRNVSPHTDIDFQRQFPSPYLTAASLTDFLASRLPQYLLPARYVFLPAFPLTANGKIDRRALQKSGAEEPQDTKTLTLPRTTAETILAEIWQEVLGRKEQISIHDNFFSLGGDSILAILVVGHAAKAGLHIVTKQLFQHPTIAELAALAVDTPAFQAEQGLITGQIPLTPIQHWFFETVEIDRHHWNQAVLLQSTQHLQPAFLKDALQSLLIHHDMLRARFCLVDATWQQFIAEPPSEIPFQVVDLTGTNQKTQRLKEIAAELQKTLDMEQGRLIQVALFDLGSEQRLLIVLHHLLIDGVSWRILLEDLQNAYEQARLQQVIQLPAKTTSFKHWSESLTTYACSPILQEELAYWLKYIPDQISPFNVDYPGGANTVASERSVSLALTPEETEFLLQHVPQVFQTQINDVLLAALAQTFASWSKERYLLIDLEGHGREDILEHAEVSRTVAWFTSLFPVAFDLHRVKTCEDALKYTKEQLRTIPHQGIGYGLLRYLNEATSVALATKPQANVRFNYLGQIEQTGTDSSLFSLVEEEIGAVHSLAGFRSHLFDVTGRVFDGRLRFDWLYSEAIHAQATVENLVDSYGQSLRAILAYCRTPDAGGYTPSDFPRSELDQDELDDLLAQLGDILA